MPSWLEGGVRWGAIYWFAFPAFVMKPAWEIGGEGEEEGG
jgi:hypothetical protein